MAHGKPVEKTSNVVSKDALAQQMAQAWDEFLTADFALHAYEQVKSFEHSLLDQAGISIGASLTSAFGSWPEKKA